MGRPEIHFTAQNFSTVAELSSLPFQFLNVSLPQTKHGKVSFVQNELVRSYFDSASEWYVIEI